VNVFAVPVIQRSPWRPPKPNSWIRSWMVKTQNQELYSLTKRTHIAIIAC